MKYSQLVQMAMDVKHWLEEQLQAQGMDGVVYTKYLITLLQEDTVDDFLDFMPPALDTKQKYRIKNLLEELNEKLKEIGQRELDPSESSTDRKVDTLHTDSNHGFSYKLNTCMNLIEPIQPCLPPTSAWTRGLLHDSQSETIGNKDKMGDYFAKLFHDNPGDVFGIDFAWNKSDVEKNGWDTNRINFYNRQNLLSTECAEKNADIEKLIAKFDANIEDIWKTTTETDHVKYQTLLTQNLFPNSYIQYGSNVIWGFDETKNWDEKVGKEEKEVEGNYKSSFFHWNKFSSPILRNANVGFDAMLSAFNMTFSNVQKWSGTGGLEKIDCNSLGNGNLKTENTADVTQNNQDEEDLLTSTKTHFRPIKTEELEGSQTGTYADGTTFAISNDLEKVSFKRSESGTLYLEDADTPRKYMEYKEANIKGVGEWESDDSSVEEFIPKFRVRQNNEKCCQTDEIDEEQIVPSMSEADRESVSYESDEDEFYFPGDEELAQNIINAIEEENGKDCNYNDKMEILEMSMYKSQGECICKKNDEGNIRQEWSEIWKADTTCDNCNSEKLSKKDKFRFREELTQEGEQLLMDLSCLQQMYSNSEWHDDDSATGSDVNEEESLLDDVGNEELGVLGKGTWWSWLVAKDESVKTNLTFDLRSLWKDESMGSNHTSDNADNSLNEIIERPTGADVMQKERKRKNSSSQKASELYMEGQCQRPHCRFAHCDSAILCPFFADASCPKGESCSLSHGTRRSLSL